MKNFKFTFKECFYILPCLCNTAFVFLFFRLEIHRIIRNIAWITPFFAIQYLNGISIWLGWLNGGVYYENGKFGTCKYDRQCEN